MSDKKKVSAFIKKKDGYYELTRYLIDTRGLLYAQNLLREMREFAPEALKGKERSKRSLYRTKAKIRDILRLNLNDSARFVTLTFKEEIKDYKMAYKRFNNFMVRKVNNTGEQLKYLVVKELQNENRGGVIHYHMITFNRYDIDYNQAWSYGFSYTKDIIDYDYERLSNYFVSYLTKDTKNQLIEKNKNIFSYSKNLIMPQRNKISENQYYMLVDAGLPKIYVGSENAKMLVKNDIEALAVDWFGSEKVKIYA